MVLVTKKRRIAVPCLTLGVFVVRCRIPFGFNTEKVGLNMSGMVLHPSLQYGGLFRECTRNNNSPELA